LGQKLGHQVKSEKILLQTLLLNFKTIDLRFRLPGVACCT